jgi:prevent-host-death family protein
MKTASVSEVKARLSHFLRLVRRGGEIQILDRGVPIARLVGDAGSSARGDKERVARLVREGILRRGEASLTWLFDEPPLVAAGAKLSQAVEQDRQDRI